MLFDHVLEWEMEMDVNDDNSNSSFDDEAYDDNNNDDDKTISCIN